MKTSNLFNYTKLSNYIKLATVLLIDAIPVGIIISFNYSNNAYFAGFGTVINFFTLIVFNFWALLIYYLTKRMIQKIVPRDVSFYVLLLLGLCIPAMMWFGYWKSFFD